MTPSDLIIVIILVTILGIAAFYIRKEKKQGKCIGCPYAKECAANKSGQSCSNQIK